jgi:NAD(P)-dependent dehydrogenase (short-subunit alcohol dehydrogenase family)
LKTVVNLNSIASHNLRPNASAYGASKYAVLRLAEFLMVENAEKGLLAYCVHPGAIMTNLAEAMPKDTHTGEF